MLKPLLDYPLQEINQWRFNSHPMQQPVVIAGAPRSGTSWLFEMLMRMIPRSLGLWEPLRMSKYPRMRELTYTMRPYLPPDNNNTDYIKFFADLLSGRNARIDTIYRGYPLHLLNYFLPRPRLLIKFVRANRILPWLLERFSPGMVFLIIRHPCAVVASQLNHPSWNPQKILNDQRYPIVNREFLDRLPQVEPLLKKRLTPEEKMAVTWGFDYYIPLFHLKHPRVKVIPYERLVTHGAAELDGIARRLNVDPPQQPDQLLKKPSRASSPARLDRDPSTLNHWKHHLSPDQIKRVLEVTHRFGLDFYTDQPEPDYDKMGLQ